MAGNIACRGDEWLDHPGTLGRGLGEVEVKIVGTEGEELATGEVGGIYTRTPTGPLAFYYGKDVAPLPRTADGFVTVGDLGWMDEDGYVFLADRRVDMIVSGAANVFPAEVESALSEHPRIADVVVIGLADSEWGRRVHAIVQPVAGEAGLDPDEVIGFAKQRLAPYKVPKTVEVVAAIPRSDAMKLNRAALVAERDAVAGSPATR
jgi:bile acid-coenzyme A ligase